MDDRPNLFAGGSGTGHRLDEWLASARADGAARARERESFLRRSAPEDATFAGVLLDLAEQGAPVVISGVAGRRHAGRVRAVGTDFVALRTAEGRDVVLAHRGIASVRTDARSPVAAGERGVELAPSLAELLAVLREDEPRVLVLTTATDEGLSGDLVAVGRDVAAVRCDGAAQTAYVAIGAIAEVTLA